MTFSQLFKWKIEGVSGLLSGLLSSFLGSLLSRILPTSSVLRFFVHKRQFYTQRRLTRWNLRYLIVLTTVRKTSLKSTPRTISFDFLPSLDLINLKQKIKLLPNPNAIKGGQSAILDRMDLTDLTQTCMSRDDRAWLAEPWFAGPARHLPESKHLCSQKDNLADSQRHQEASQSRNGLLENSANPRKDVTSRTVAQAFNSALRESSILKLGTRYLWIDALCIDQQDTHEHHRAGQNMRQAYSFASANTSAIYYPLDSMGGEQIICTEDETNNHRRVRDSSVGDGTQTMRKSGYRKGAHGFNTKLPYTRSHRTNHTNKDMSHGFMVEEHLEFHLPPISRRPRVICESAIWFSMTLLLEFCCVIEKLLRNLTVLLQFQYQILAIGWFGFVSGSAIAASRNRGISPTQRVALPRSSGTRDCSNSPNGLGCFSILKTLANTNWLNSRPEVLVATSFFCTAPAVMIYTVRRRDAFQKYFLLAGLVLATCIGGMKSSSVPEFVFKYVFYWVYLALALSAAYHIYQGKKVEQVHQQCSRCHEDVESADLYLSISKLNSATNVFGSRDVASGSRGATTTCREKALAAEQPVYTQYEAILQHCISVPNWHGVSGTKGDNSTQDLDQNHDQVSRR
ncbi:hypothetical protein B0J14DRAFT_641447 [Halenospora varia]|nr:hypothetical protein B0J14DRAFT_641447 [Halenospora varia]